MPRQRSARDYPLNNALDFLQRLWRMNHALEKLSSRMDKELGVTAQQRFMLRCIGKYPGLTAGRLAALLHVDPGTVSAALRRLEAKGLLQRQRNPRDRRRASLGLTALGRELDAPSEHTVEQAAELLLASTPAEQLAAMVSVVDSLSEILDELTNRSEQKHAREDAKAMAGALARKRERGAGRREAGSPAPSDGRSAGRGKSRSASAPRKKARATDG